MERRTIELYGGRNSRLAVDTLLGYGPGSLGLVMVDVTIDGRPHTVALEPAAAKELGLAIRDAMREIAADAQQTAELKVPTPARPRGGREPAEEMDALYSRGMSVRGLKQALGDGTLGGPPRLGRAA